jgi:hypothetical protein
MEQAASIDDLMIGQVFSIGSESRRMAYLKKVRGNLEGFISLVSQHLSSSQAAINSAIELVLQRRAIGAEALAAQRDAVLVGRYPELEPKLKDLINLRMQIAQKTLAGPGQEGLAEHRKTLSIWNKQKENLEAELARQIPEMNLEQKLKQIDRQTIASTLPEGAALIEFVHFDVLDFKAVPAKGESSLKQARYLAFVILAGELRAKALKNAQMSIRSKHPHPFFWGAFICQGDPSPLSSGQKFEIRSTKYETITQIRIF